MMDADAIAIASSNSRWAMGSSQTRLSGFRSSNPASHRIPSHHRLLPPAVSAYSLWHFSSRIELLEDRSRSCPAANQKGGTPVWRKRLQHKDSPKEFHGRGSRDFCISENFVVHTLFRRPRRRPIKSRAGGNNPEQSSVPSLCASKENKGPSAVVLDAALSIWRQVLTPLSNFGFGKQSLWEAGVGLFIMSGVALLSLALSWLKGYQLRSRTLKYQAVIEFSNASGIGAGTPVRIRGVDVGTVVSVRPSLESIDVVVQVLDANVAIPRNSLVEVNQSGLLMETLIDITPRNPLPQPTRGPLDPGCSEEGLIVCDREKIKGEQGVNLDELVGVSTKLAREVDAIGINQVYSLADRMATAVEEAKPLLSKVETLAGDIEPLLKQVRDVGMLKELEKLAKVLTEVSLDAKRLNESVLTPENTLLLRHSVSTLTKTIKNIENISGDVSGLTGDVAARHNMKQFIESLRRLIAG